MIEKILNIRKVAKINTYPIVMAIVFLLLCLLPYNLKSAITYAQTASKEGNKNINTAIKDIKTAIDKDPLKEQYIFDYLKFSMAANKNSEDLLGMVEKSAELGKYSSDSMADAGSYYLRLGDVENGIAAFDKALQLRPLRPEEWQQMVGAYYSVVYFYVTTKDADKNAAINYIDKCLQLVDNARKINEKNMNPFTFNSNTLEMLEKLKLSKENILAKKQFNMEKLILDGVYYVDVNIDSVTDQWNIENKPELHVKFSNGVLMSPGSNNGAPYVLKSRSLGLKANKQYTIVARFKNSRNAKSIPFEITDLAKAELLPSGNQYASSFSIPAGVKVENDGLKLTLDENFQMEMVRITED